LEEKENKGEKKKNWKDRRKKGTRKEKMKIDVIHRLLERRREKSEIITTEVKYWQGQSDTGRRGEVKEGSVNTTRCISMFVRSGERKESNGEAKESSSFKWGN